MLVIFPTTSGRLIPEKKVAIRIVIIRGIATNDNILRIEPASRKFSP